jgi:hypothetical protein
MKLYCHPAMQVMYKVVLVDLITVLILDIRTVLDFRDYSARLQPVYTAGQLRVNHILQGEHSNFERYVPIKNFFCDRTIFEKFNFKMTACPLTVIPPKCKGVPITQLEKKINVQKFFFYFQKKLKYFW